MSLRGWGASARLRRLSTPRHVATSTAADAALADAVDIRLSFLPCVTLIAAVVMWLHPFLPLLLLLLQLYHLLPRDVELEACRADDDLALLLVVSSSGPSRRPSQGPGRGSSPLGGA